MRKREREYVGESWQREREKYGERHHVEIVSTHALKRGDLIWTGQDFHAVLDTKLESEIEGGFRKEDQCAVLWRELSAPDQYTKRGYTIFGDVVLRVIPNA